MSYSMIAELAQMRFASTMLEKRKSIGRVLVALFLPPALVAVAVQFYLVSQFIRAPLSRQESTGNVVAWNNHGVLHYVTYGQNQIYELTWPLIFVFTLLACIGVALI